MRAARTSVEIENSEIAETFEQVADLLEIQGQSHSRARAYRDAAHVLRGLARPVRQMLEQGADLAALPGIGAELAEKIAEVARGGPLALLDELAREIAPGVTELLVLRGLGPRRVRQLHDELQVRSLEDLERALREGRLDLLAGFGPALRHNLLGAIEQQQQGARTPWALAEPHANALLDYLRASPAILRAELAGSFRRRKESVGDLDLLVAARRPAQALEHFVAFPAAGSVLARGSTRAALLLHSGLQVDLRVVDEAEFGAAFVYLTGSKAHNIALRLHAQERGLWLNEYGVFRGKTRIAAESEEQVYAALGLPFVEPELREDRGELAAARENRLPELVALGELRGDLHVHSSASDGSDSVEDLARAALQRGHAYLAIADHTASARFGRGLETVELEAHLERIERARAQVPGLQILKAAEVDILGDGALDLPEALLDSLDLVVAAVHSGLDLSRERQTQRVLAALRSGRVHVLAHPGGRLIGSRAGLELDFGRVIAAAREHGCALELNSQPLRLDLDEHYCRAAREAGVLVAISSDAHSVGELDFLHLGVGQARRGWLAREHVLNTLSWPSLARWLKR